MVNRSTGVSSSHNTEYEQSLNAAIDKLEEALDHARAMPKWGAALVVMVSLLCVIILLHALAFFAAAPCLYGMWKRRVREQGQLVETGGDEEVIAENGDELSEETTDEK